MSVKVRHGYKPWLGLKLGMQTVAWYPSYIRPLYNVLLSFELITKIRFSNKSGIIIIAEFRILRVSFDRKSSSHKQLAYITYANELLWQDIVDKTLVRKIKKFLDIFAKTLK